MADYVGIAEVMPLADLPAFMSGYYETQGQAISSNGGTISLLIGDNIMAVWDQPASASLACNSALAQCDAMKDFAEWANARSYPSPAVRIGIHTAMMNIQRGPGPNDVRVLGDGVNTAARLEQLNKYYGTRILITDATLAGLDASLIVRPVDVVRVKGKEHPVMLFELVGPASGIDTDKGNFLQTFKGAFANYEAANFGEALIAFEAAQTQMPTDALTGLFVSRCSELMMLPPPEFWDGVMTYRAK